MKNLAHACHLQQERKAGTMDSIDDHVRPSSTGLDFSDEEEIGAWIWNFSRNASWQDGPWYGKGAVFLE